MVSVLLFGAFVVITTINIFYFLFFARFAFSSHPKGEANVNSPVSIIVYAKNAEDKIDTFLQQFEHQTHQNFELVLVNNASHDNTRFIFEEFQKNHSNVSIVNVVNNENFWASKKYALTLGIKKATHDTLLFTDISVKIPSKNWITANANLLEGKKKIIVGKANFAAKKGFLNYIIRFYDFINQMINFGFGAMYKPFSASPFHFGFTKELFYKVNGFSEYMSISHATEDLFLRHNGTTRNVSLATDVNHTVEIEAPQTFKNWFQTDLEIRKAKDTYSSIKKTLINLFHLSQWLFFVLAVVALVFIPTKVLLYILLARYVVVSLIYFKTAAKWQQTSLVYFFPFMEILNCILRIPMFFQKLIAK